MPPRKKARGSEVATPQPKKPIEGPTPEATPDRVNVLNDPWTDDEETQLFKSMIKFKPTGIHKHFRMIAIQNQLSSHGFTGAGVSHTKIPGIWAKLDSLYDLEVLDERENAHIGILVTPSDSEAEDEVEEEDEDDNVEESWRRQDFDLPDDEFKELAFSRRLSSSRRSSPEAIAGLSRTRNILGEEELREKREEYDKEELSSAKGRGRNPAGRKPKRGRVSRSTRSTPADAEGDEEDDDEDEEVGEEASTVDDSPQSKGMKSSTRAKSTRRSRKR